MHGMVESAIRWKEGIDKTGQVAGAHSAIDKETAAQRKGRGTSDSAYVTLRVTIGLCWPCPRSSFPRADAKEDRPEGV